MENGGYEGRSTHVQLIRRNNNQVCLFGYRNKIEANYVIRVMTLSKLYRRIFTRFERYDYLSHDKKIRTSKLFISLCLPVNKTFMLYVCYQGCMFRYLLLLI